MRNRPGHHRKTCAKPLRRAAAGAFFAVLLLLGCGAASTGGKLGFPLGTAEWRISDPYGWRSDPFTGEKAFHSGVDLACAEGSAVLAAQDGVVAEARYSVSYGNYLRILHAGGAETLYAHLQYLYARAGEVVEAGQPVGTAGQTGRATGAHLHFELRQQGTLCDPAAALGLPE